MYRATPYASNPGNPPQGPAISELSPAAQAHLLKSLIQVKQALAGRHDVEPQPDMGPLTEEMFWSTSSPDPRSCLLEALGTFLVQIMGVLSQLSVSLTNGPHLAAYVEAYIRSVTADDDFSDDSVVSFLDKKISMLMYATLVKTSPSSVDVNKATEDSFR